MRQTSTQHVPTTLLPIQECNGCNNPPTSRPIPPSQMSNIRARIGTRQMGPPRQTGVTSQRTHRPHLTTHRMQRCNYEWPPPSNVGAVNSSNLLSELRKQQIQRKSHSRPSNHPKSGCSQFSHRSNGPNDFQSTRSTAASRSSHMFVDLDSSVVELPLNAVLDAMQDMSSKKTNNVKVGTSSRTPILDANLTSSSQSSVSSQPSEPFQPAPCDAYKTKPRDSRCSGILVNGEDYRQSVRQNNPSGIQFADNSTPPTGSGDAITQQTHPSVLTENGEQPSAECHSVRPRNCQSALHSFAPPAIQEFEQTTPRFSDDEFELPDREELTDQLEWDVGVAQTLFHFKRLQIQEQINIDMRSKKSKTSCKQCRSSMGSSLKDAAQPLPPVKERRKSCMDHMRASQACGFATCPSMPDFHARSSQTSGVERGSCVSRQGSIIKPKFLAAEYRLADEMRSKSQRALFEGLAHTAEMSRDRWYISQPTGTARHVWSNLVAVVTIITAILSPLLACQVLDSSSAVTEIVEFVIDVVFIADIVIQFFTAYQDEVRDIVVTSPSHIRVRYLKGWFWFDVISALPIDWFLQIKYGSDANLSAWRLLKISRAYHMFSAEDVHLNLGDTAINPSLIALFKLTLALGLFWHVTACLYSLMSVATLQSIKLLTNSSNAIVSVFDDSVIESVTNLRFQMNATQTIFHMGMVIDNDASQSQWHMPQQVWNYGPLARYFFSVSWAIAVTCQTHRPIPDTFIQLVMSDVVSVSGLFLMTGIIGAATAAISEMQAQRSENTRLLQRIAHYMRNKRLPRDLRRRVLSFYRFHQSSMNILENEEVLVGLPRAMRMQINLLMHKSVFVKLPLFWLCTEEEMLLIVQRLRPCLIMPGEMMLKEGTIGAGLFLLMKGAVETIAEGELLVVLLAVAAFGEAALQSEEASKVTIRALRFCETSLLMRADWVVIEKLNPRIRTWLDIYINERDRKIRDPTVKSQSQQTKNATIRCGAAGYRDWNDMRNSTGTKTNKCATSALAVAKVGSLFRSVRRESVNLGRKSTEATFNFRRRMSSIINAANAVSTNGEPKSDSCEHTAPSNLSKDSNQLYASSKKLRVCDGHVTNRDDVRNSGYFPGMNSTMDA